MSQRKPIVPYGVAKQGQSFSLTKDHATFGFKLLASDGAAVQQYQEWKAYESKKTPVFREETAARREGCVYFTEQIRGEHGFTGQFVSKASFRLQNVFVHVMVHDDKSRGNTLTFAIADLAQILSTALTSTNQMPK